MDTKKWGKACWQFLFCVAFNYPEQPTEMDKHHYRQLFQNLIYTLPCKYCRESWREFMNEQPIDFYLGTRQSLTFWLYKMKQKVNDKLKRQGNNVSPDPGFGRVCEYYNDCRAKCNDKSQTCRKAENKSFFNFF